VFELGSGVPCKFWNIPGLRKQMNPQCSKSGEYFNSWNLRDDNRLKALEMDSLHLQWSMDPGIHEITDMDEVLSVQVE
jgi:hypothetical protein